MVYSFIGPTSAYLYLHYCGCGAMLRQRYTWTTSTRQKRHFPPVCPPGGGEKAAWQHMVPKWRQNVAKVCPFYQYWRRHVNVGDIQKNLIDQSHVAVCTPVVQK